VRAGRSSVVVEMSFGRRDWLVREMLREAGNAAGGDRGLPATWCSPRRRLREANGLARRGSSIYAAPCGGVEFRVGITHGPRGGVTSQTAALRLGFAD